MGAKTAAGRGQQRPTMFSNAEAAGVVIVHQDQPLVGHFDVTRNIFLGREIIRGGLLDFGRMRAVAEGLLDRIGAVTIAGRMTLRDHAERRLGFAQVIERDFSHLRLLPVAEGLDDWAVTEPMVAAALRGRPDLVGVYSMGAGNRGIVRALEAAGRSRDVVAIGHELTPFMRQALLSGAFDAAITRIRPTRCAGPSARSRCCRTARPTTNPTPCGSTST